MSLCGTSHVSALSHALENPRICLLMFAIAAATLPFSTMSALPPGESVEKTSSRDLAESSRVRVTETLGRGVAGLASGETAGSVVTSIASLFWARRSWVSSPRAYG